MAIELLSAETKRTVTMNEKTNEQEQIANLIRTLDAEFCRLPIPRGVHAVIQNGMSELANKVKRLLGESMKDDSTGD